MILVPRFCYTEIGRTILFFMVFCIWVPVEGAGGGGNATGSASKLRSVSFGALFTLNSVIGGAAAPAIDAAVDDVNSDPNVLSGIKLNVIVHDTNCSGFFGTMEGNFYSQN